MREGLGFSFVSNLSKKQRYELSPSFRILHIHACMRRPGGSPEHRACTRSSWHLQVISLHLKSRTSVCFTVCSFISLSERSGPKPLVEQSTLYIEYAYMYKYHMAYIYPPDVVAFVPANPPCGSLFRADFVHHNARLATRRVWGQARSRETAVARVVVVGGSYGGVELACNLATELGATAAAGGGKVEVTLAAGSEVRGCVYGGGEGGEGGEAGRAMLLCTALTAHVEGQSRVRYAIPLKKLLFLSRAQVLMWEQGCGPSLMVSIRKNVFAYFSWEKMVKIEPAFLNSPYFLALSVLRKTIFPHCGVPSSLSPITWVHLRTQG